MKGPTLSIASILGGALVSIGPFLLVNLIYFIVGVRSYYKD